MREFIIKSVIGAAVLVTVELPIAIGLIQLVSASGAFELVGWIRPTWEQAALIAAIITIAAPVAVRLQHRESRTMRIEDSIKLADPHTGSSQAIVDAANQLARAFYARMGCTVIEGHRFDRARHPQERLCWLMAADAFAQLRGTDIDDALSELDDE